MFQLRVASTSVDLEALEQVERSFTIRNLIQRMDKKSGSARSVKDLSAKALRFCVKCRNHGRKNFFTGHKNVCPFKICNCGLCNLTEAAKNLSLTERQLHRRFDRMDRKQKAVPNQTPKVFREQRNFQHLETIKDEWLGEAVVDLNTTGEEPLEVFALEFEFGNFQQQIDQEMERNDQFSLINLA